MRDPDGVIFDGGIRLHFREDGHDDLARSPALEVLQRAVQLFRRGARDHPRIIIEVPFWPRRHDLRRRPVPAKQKNQSRQKSHSSHHLPPGKEFEASITGSFKDSCIAQHSHSQWFESPPIASAPSAAVSQNRTPPLAVFPIPASPGSTAAP